MNKYRDIIENMFLILIKNSNKSTIKFPNHSDASHYLKPE